MTSTPSSAAEPAWPDDAVEVGRIGGAWGVKGWFKVQPFAADPQALFSSKRWFLREPDDARPARPGAAALPALLKIVEAKEHGDGVVARAQEVADRDAAEALRGARIFVGRSSFPTAGADEYYWVDLIGLPVRNREGVALGEVVDLMSTGPQQVLVVHQAQGAARPIERLIPFVDAYVDEVDLPARRVLVDWQPDY